MLDANIFELDGYWMPHEHRPVAWPSGESRTRSSAQGDAVTVSVRDEGRQVLAEHKPDLLVGNLVVKR